MSPPLTRTESPRKGPNPIRIKPRGSDRGLRTRGSEDPCLPPPLIPGPARSPAGGSPPIGDGSRRIRAIRSADLGRVWAHNRDLSKAPFLHLRPLKIPCDEESSPPRP